MRQTSTSIIMATGQRSLKAQLRQANTSAIRHAVIIGEQEVKSGTVVLRDMTNARQKTVNPAALPGLLG